MTANCEGSDICNVQGDDAKRVLAEMNRLHEALQQPLPHIMQQELTSQLETWQMVLEDSGHQICHDENGYDFKRNNTGAL